MQRRADSQVQRFHRHDRDGALRGAEALPLRGRDRERRTLDPQPRVPGETQGDRYVSAGFFPVRAKRCVKPCCKNNMTEVKCGEEGGTGTKIRSQYDD